MPLLEWNDTFSVGFEEIDNDHKQLIGIVNRLDDAITAGKEFAVVGDLLDELVSYTLWHFRHEERLMQSYGDPTFYDHKQEHEALAEAAAAKQQEFQGGNQDVARELMPFLKGWLTKHIQGTDSRTGHYLAKQVEESKVSA
jgi:hemerythrin-like metal-binding protein